MHEVLVVSCLESFTHNLTSTIEVKKKKSIPQDFISQQLFFGKDNQQQLKVLLSI